MKGVYIGVAAALALVAIDVMIVTAISNNGSPVISPKEQTLVCVDSQNNTTMAENVTMRTFTDTSVRWRSNDGAEGMHLLTPGEWCTLVSQEEPVDASHTRSL